jgi:hypothetical protein
MESFERYRTISSGLHIGAEIVRALLIAAGALPVLPLVWKVVREKQ